VKSFKGISFFKCQVFPKMLSFFQNGSKEFHKLKLLHLAKASPNTVEIFIQGQDLSNL
jgi:hypothetical protein